MGAAVGGTGVEVAGNFSDGHAIFVHARPALRHRHWLQELDPVSFPDHPFSTTSPPARVQTVPSSIPAGGGVRVGSIDSGVVVGNGVSVGTAGEQATDAIKRTATTANPGSVLVKANPLYPSSQRRRHC